MTIIILIIWCVQVLAKLAAATVLVRRGLVRQYPGLVAWLGLTSAKMVVLLLVWAINGTAAYRHAWKFTQAFEMALYMGLVVDLVYHISRHFQHRRSGRFAAVVMVAFFTLSTVLVLVTAHLWRPPWPSVVTRIIEVSGYHTAICAGTVIGTWVWYSQALVPWRSNVVRHVVASVILLAGDALGYVTYRGAAGNHALQVIGQLLLVTPPVASCAIWMGMRRKGEEYEEPDELGVVKAQTGRLKRLRAVAGGG